MIVGVLSWFDESPSWLAACVASMARVCGHVVAVDGRYGHFEHPNPVSPIEQAEAVVETAAGAGLPLTLHRPAQPFYGNEVEKRNLTLKLATAVGEPGRDWLLVLDGDCYITEHSEMLPVDLDRTDALAANVDVDEVLDFANPDKPIDVMRITSIPSVARSPVTLLYRLLDDMRYVDTHYTLGGMYQGEWVWLWGHPQAVAAEKMPAPLVVRHRNVMRPVYRRKQAADYYRIRDELNLEPSRGRVDWAAFDLSKLKKPA